MVDIFRGSNISQMKKLAQITSINICGCGQIFVGVVKQ